MTFTRFFLLLLFFPSLLLAQEVQIPRLTPFPVELQSVKVDLNGEWLFNTDPKENFWKTPQTTDCKPIQVPGEWVMQGFDVAKGTQAGYYRQFELPANWKGQRIKLRSNGIYSESVLYINGKEVGKHIGGFTPFEIDITRFVHYGGKNQITVAVRNEGKADSLASGSRYAVHPLGGITRDIFLFAVPETNIASFHVKTDFDDAYSNAMLSAEVQLTNESHQLNDRLQLSFTLLDADGKTIELGKEIYAIDDLKEGGRLDRTLKFQVNTPHHWTSESPYLYTFICALKDGAKTLHRTQRRVGFRELEVKGNQFLVNGKPIKLRGVNRHEVMPLRGRSLEGDIWAKDVKLFRDANVNYIRTSHYPPDERLLEACDELGMFVEVEAPFCWAHETVVKKEEMYPLLVNQHVEMVNRDKSHPSIIMWSLGNESNLYQEYFKKAGEVIKKMDPSRPRIFSQWGPDADSGELEVTNHHYPGPTGPELYKNSKRPVTFDEYIHVNSYNRFELSADPGVRNMWGPLLDRMWTDMYNSKGVLGGAIWAGIDDTFFLPNNKVVGYGTWGPLDGWRREKPEYWNMKKSYSPVKIVQRGNLSNDRILSLDVENRHNFTNLSACTFEWHSGQDSGSVQVNVAARSTGQFDIDLKDKQQLDRDIHLKIKSPLGFVIDEYTFVLVPVVATNKMERKERLHLEENKETIVIRDGDKVCEINKSDGLLRIFDTKGNSFINKGGALMLLPLNSEGRGIQMIGKDQNFEPYNPICENWVCQSISWTSGKDKATIRVKGAYKEAVGEYIYVFEANGLVTIEYTFQINSPVSPRQIGLVFEVPKEFSTLEWKRKGYWNIYPKDHLGSLTGSAMAFNPEIPISASAGPSTLPKYGWSFDQTDAGANLFRATKESIYNADLSTPDGNKIKVVSDGNQHFRAWINSSKTGINMLVADYNNAGREGFLSSHAEADYRNLKRGDQVKGKVSLRFEK
jgi:beta-galactosidase